MNDTMNILTQTAAVEQVRQWQRSGKKVVFSNGCFDILHAGHVTYLAAARALGDVLIIGINSDASVKRLKGPGRPICSQLDRAALLRALRMVDAVTLFDEDTPEQLISTLLPDILVKGADWDINQIAGARQVLENGGKVLTIPLLEGRSTSTIIETVTQRYSQSTANGGKN